MSASTERKNRLAARAAGTDKKQLAAQEAAEKSRKTRRKWIIGTVAVVLCIALVLFLSSPVFYRITKAETPTQAEIASRVQQLDERYRNAYRVTDIRNITFEIKQGEIKSTGTAEMICVTGKWYIGDVTGI